MSKDIVTPSERLVVSIEQRRNELIEQVADTIKQSKSKNTWRAYESAWDAFDRFCESMKLVALPAEPLSVCMFLEEQLESGLSVSTLEQRIAAIRTVHLTQNLPTPTEAQIVRDQMKGIRRKRKNTPSQAKSAATSTIVRDMNSVIDAETLLGKRDRALLLYGYGGALRRSELVAINVEHIENVKGGHLLTLPGSKRDQEGKGEKIAVLARPESPLCPVTAMTDWLRTSGVRKGAVFRRFFRGDTMGEARLSDKAVERLVKDLAYRVRLDYTQYSAHSLRSGFITSAVVSGARWDKVMSHARHRKFDTTLGYIDDREKFTDHAGENIVD